MSDDKGMIETGQNMVRDELEKLSEEEREAVEVYQALMQKLGEKLARRMAPAGTIGANWEQGATYIDGQASLVVEDIMRRFFGEMNLSEFVGFCSSMAGYQAGVAGAKGFDLPDNLCEEAGKIFAAGMRVVAITSEYVMRSGQGPAMVPGLPGAPKA